MAIEIIATGRAVPANRVTNDDLATRIDTSDEWIRSHTGIGSRHLADDDTATSDLSYEASMRALEALVESGHAASIEEAAMSLDVIIIGTATPDFNGFPSTACIVQDRLGAQRAGAVDVAAGCTGFVYAMETAAGILTMGKGRKRALVLGAEILSRITNWEDRGTCVLFGDGASAVILEKTDAPSEGPGKRGLLRSILGAEGNGADHLKMERGGSRKPFKKGEVIDTPPHLEMNGRAVYNFAVRAVTDTIKQLLEEEGVGFEDLALIIPHQANARIVQAAAKRLGIPEEKFYLNIEEYANTSAASIPIALDEVVRAGKLKKGDLVLTVGFGAGLTYAGNLFVW